MYYGSTYYLVILGFFISLIATWNVKGTFSRYSKVSNSHGLTGRECAMRILNSAGIYDVTIEPIKGSLTDHYSPNEKVLRLSQDVYNSCSVAALGIAAHECGHAIQHHKEYFPLNIRNTAIGFTNFTSNLSWPVLMLGVILGSEQLAEFGAFLFFGVVFFQLVTLPVEFNASRRAIKILNENNMLIGYELQGAKKVLFAAAMTYVASLVTTLLQWLRLIMIAKGTNRRR